MVQQQLLMLSQPPERQSQPAAAPSPPGQSQAGQPPLGLTMMQQNCGTKNSPPPL
jgi:hypothetical protein